MELVRKEPAIVNCFAAVTGAGRVTALQDEVGDEPVEDGISIVAINAELEEVARGKRCLDGPKLDVDVAMGGFENYLCTGGFS